MLVPICCHTHLADLVYQMFANRAQSMAVGSNSQLQALANDVSQSMPQIQAVVPLDFDPDFPLEYLVSRIRSMFGRLPLIFAQQGEVSSCPTKNPALNTMILALGI